MRKRLPFSSFNSSSTVRMPAMPLPITTRCSRGSAIMFMGRLLDAHKREVRRLAAPAQAHRADAAPGADGQCRGNQEAEGVAAGELLGIAQAGGEIEAA